MEKMSELLKNVSKNIIHDPALDKYSAMVLFPDKIERLIKIAREKTLRKTGPTYGEKCLKMS